MGRSLLAAPLPPPAVVLGIMEDDCWLAEEEAEAAAVSPPRDRERRRKTCCSLPLLPPPLPSLLPRLLLLSGPCWPPQQPPPPDRVRPHPPFCLSCSPTKSPQQRMNESTRRRRRRTFSRGRDGRRTVGEGEKKRTDDATCSRITILLPILRFISLQINFINFLLGFY